nr:RNA-dependent RNA polymerase [Flumine narna-like virus 40]
MRRDTRSTTAGASQSSLCSTKSSDLCTSVYQDISLSRFSPGQPVLTLVLDRKRAHFDSESLLSKISVEKKILKNQESLEQNNSSSTATATVEGAIDPRLQAERLFEYCRKPVNPSRVKSFIDKSINRIYQIWKVFGFASKVPYKLDRAKRLVHSVWDTYNSTNPMGVVKALKFVLLSFVRFWKGDPYEHDKNFSEPLSHPGSLFPGRGERFITRLKRVQRTEFEILINTMLISAKGCLPRPDQECQDESIVDWIKDIFLIKRQPRNEELAYRIRQYVHELIGNKRCKVSDIYLEPRVPSTSANYINGRGDGGGVLSACDLMSQVSHPKLTFEDVVLDKTFVWSDSKMEDGCLIPEWIQDEPLWELMVDKGLIQSNYEKFLKAALKSAWVEEPFVKPVALSEALKVRMITKCPPFLMFVMNAFIDPLRKLLRAMPVFELTGTPQEETIMDRMFRDPTRWFLSGDYQASTDNLHSWVSECIVDELCETYYRDVCLEDPRWIALFRRSLTGFKYQSKKGVILNQQNGQLMGSVSSFPVLCLANYALCRMAMELNPKDWRGLLVNGDDCVFEAHEYTYHEWIRLGNLMGLKPSAGKVDYKKAYIQMNSRSFIPLRDPDLANRLLNEAMNSYRDVHDETNCCFYRFPEVVDYVKSPYRIWWKVPLVLAGVAQGLTRSSSSVSSGVDLMKIDYSGSKKELPL